MDNPIHGPLFRLHLHLSRSTITMLGSPVALPQQTLRSLPSIFASHPSFVESQSSSPLTHSSRFPRLKDFLLRRRLCYRLSCVLQETSPVASESSEDLAESTDKKSSYTTRRRLYAENLPLTVTAMDIQSLFEQCGDIKKVELIKHKDGTSRGFAFITMSSPEEAFAAIEKLDSLEMGGRVIRVSYAKTAKKPSIMKPVVVETRHKIYASNLAWKVRSSHLREFFMANSNPVSARVVFESPTGKSSGYGFVSYATLEEAEAAVLALDGKELMGRPLRLRISQKVSEEEANKPDSSNQSPKEMESEAPLN